MHSGIPRNLIATRRPLAAHRGLPPAEEKGEAAYPETHIVGTTAGIGHCPASAMNTVVRAPCRARRVLASNYAPLDKVGQLPRMPKCILRRRLLQGRVPSSANDGGTRTSGESQAHVFSSGWVCFWKRGRAAPATNGLSRHRNFASSAVSPVISMSVVNHGWVSSGSLGGSGSRRRSYVLGAVSAAVVIGTYEPQACLAFLMRGGGDPSAVGTGGPEEEEAQ